jgi:hypothetical protein
VTREGVQKFLITYREATLRRLVDRGGPVDKRMRGGIDRSARKVAEWRSPR